MMTLFCGCTNSLSSDEQETVHYHPAPDIGAPDLRQETDEDRKGTTLVELIKIEGCTLGLTISGGVDKNCRPQVSNLRPGSIAHRCDALEVGDFILSVNGIRTSGLRHEEIVNLLKNAGEHVVLEVEYEVPESALQSAFSIQCKRHEILLEKEGKSFGFTLRGGLSLERMKSRALTVTSIRPGGPADRDGHLKNGDRVIAINCFNVAHLSLSETMTMMQECESRAGFLIEYDVSVMDAVQNATGPLLVEIEKIPGVSLGIGLAHSVRNGKRSICIESVAPMGIADRSGAIHVGDHLLAIDGASVDHMSLAEASQLLKSGTGDQIRLEIIPISHIQQKASRELLARKALVPICMPSSVSTPALSLPHSPFGTLQNYGTVKSSGYGGQCSGTLPSRFSNYPCSQRTWTRPDRKQSSSMSVASSTVTSVMPNNQICHTEVVEVILYHDRRGPGITLAGGIFSTSLLSEPPVISYVDPGSAADRCGVIQEGDRIISVNGQELLDKTFDEANQLLKDSGSRCLLEIEYDVTESVLPSSGTFVVKLPQRSYGLGITVNAPNNRKSNDPLVITDVRKGSVANRCGSIQPGDKLLSINNVRMESCSAEDAANLLDSADDIIKLKLRRDDPYGDDDNDDCVTYTVELQKRGGVLGITISGTDSPLDPIVISGLIEGGLADRETTGAIHVGDRLLAINGNPTKGKTLSEAINMLQVAGDLVTLKISRTVEAKPKNRYNSGKRGFSPVLESPAQTPTIQYPPWQPTPPLPPLSSSTQRSHHRCRRHDNNHHLSQQQRHHSNANHSPYTRGRHRSTGDENNVSPYEAERFAAMTTTEAGKRRQNLRAMERDDPNHHPATPIPSVDSALESWGSSGLENYNQNSTSQAMVLAEPKNGVNKRTRDKSATLPADFRDYHNSVESFSDAECSTNGHQNHRNYTDDDDEEDDDEDDWDANSNASYGSSEDEWSRTCDDLENTDTSEMLRQIGASLGQGSVASLNRIRSRDARRRNKKSNCHCAQGEDAVSSSSHGSNRYSKNNNNATSKPTTGKELVPTTFEEHVQTIFSPTPIQLHRFKLQKDSATDDFGFSLSEGMYEKGVYISAVRVDSLAEKCGLQSYDRILQVNSIKTRDFDCQMAVPLISEAGNNLDLVVSRNPLASSEENGELLLKDERINHDNNSINQKPIKTSV